MESNRKSDNPFADL